MAFGHRVVGKDRRRVCGKLPEGPAVIRRASQGKSSFSLTRMHKPEEKAGSDRQNSISPRAEPKHTGFINHKVMRKRFHRDGGSLRRREVKDHRRSYLFHRRVLARPP